MRKYPRLTTEILLRYLSEYLNTAPSKMDDLEILYLNRQYSNIVDNLTRNFTEEEFIQFYQYPFSFISLMYSIFHLSRKLNFILYQYSVDRVRFLQRHGLEPKLELNDHLERKNNLEKFGSFRVIKK